MSLIKTIWWIIPLCTTIFTGLLCPAMGTVLITHKRLLQVNLISHCVLPGLALAMALGVDPSIGGVISGLVGALAADNLANNKKRISNKSKEKILYCDDHFRPITNGCSYDCSYLFS